MLDVVDLFKEQNTRDELGIGATCDALADQLFPGTGTVQTRARYILFMLGNDFVEVKTITPDKRGAGVRLKRAGNFGKLVVVKISDEFQFAARWLTGDWQRQVGHAFVGRNDRE